MEITPDLHESLILPGRTRRSAHSAALQLNDKLRGYHLAFSSTWKQIRPSTPHHDSLPLPPKSWKQMLKHPHANEFQKAVEKEYRALESKGTFIYIEKGGITQKPLPLMWTFIYKFDENGFLTKCWFTPVLIQASHCVGGSLGRRLPVYITSNPMAASWSFSGRKALYLCTHRITVILRIYPYPSV